MINLTEETKLPLVIADSFEEYLASPFISSSKLKRLKQSALHFRDAEIKETKSLKLGTAIHSAILTAEEFRTKYVCLKRDKLPEPQSDFRNAKNRDYKLKFESDAKDSNQIVLVEEEYEVATGVNQSVLRQKNFMVILENAICEHSFYYKDEDSGIHCKARPDIVNLGAGLMADIKSTADSAHPHAVSRTVAKWDYCAQAGFHSLAVDFCKQVEIEDFFWIFAETTKPYAISINKLHKDDLIKSKAQAKQYLMMAKDIIEKDDWYGYERFSNNEYGINLLNQMPPWYWMSEE